MENTDNINEIRDMNFELENSDSSFVSELIKIKRSSQTPETKLNLLDLLIKDFLTKKFHIKKNTEYTDLVEYFLQKEKPEVAVFCHQMIKQLYGGESLNNNIMDILIDEAKEMINKELGNESKSDNKKGVIASLFKSKKKPIEISDSSSNVSKQTEKIINKALIPEGIIQVENLRDENPGKDIEEFQSIESSLSKNIKNQQMLENNIESDNASIRSIDNLDRIKEKVRIRKLEVAKEKSDYNSSNN